MVDDDSLDEPELSSVEQNRSDDWLALQIAVLGFAFDAPFPGLMSLGGGGRSDGAGKATDDGPNEAGFIVRSARLNRGSPRIGGPSNFGRFTRRSVGAASCFTAAE